VLAGALIALAVLIADTKTTTPGNIAAPLQNPTTEGQAMKPISTEDHIIGNPNAELVIVEFSDASCPYCKSFHTTMRQVMDTYGRTGNVAWVFRHYPLDKPDSQGFVLHKNAGHEAIAMECAADQGGNAGFWKFTNRLFEVTPSVTGATPNGLDQTLLPKIAEEAGLDKNAFNDCLQSGRMKEVVDAQYVDGVNAGVSATPYSFILTRDGKRVPIVGAQPYQSVVSAIEALLDAANAKAKGV
jgi:protein-disulfide isomerase